MICKISDLITTIPDAGGLPPRCKGYIHESLQDPDITIDPHNYQVERYPDYLPYATIEYMESGFLFYEQLLNYQGLMLHASAIEYSGKAYLFSGKSGVGKSTHTKLWQQLLGTEAHVFNDDKPALRFQNHRWYAYGTPWCGKDGINQNKKIPLAGICFLKQGQENRICRLSTAEALPRLISQTLRRRLNKEQMEKLLVHLEMLVLRIPVYELENRPEIEAAQLSYETMCQGAKEAEL